MKYKEFHLVSTGALRASTLVSRSSSWMYPPPLLRGVLPPRQDRFRLSNGHTETHTGEQNSATMDYKLQSAPHYNHKYKHIIMRTIKPQYNVNVTYKNPRTRPYKIQTMQWHDRWRPHASQWPKPAYHHSPLTESARPEHEPIPKSELKNSRNPTRETKE